MGAIKRMLMVDSADLRRCFLLGLTGLGGSIGGL